ncbi:hypothetical protein M2447_001952 [Ereboglobus sp. PH5-10]|nr:hypothetical protein [Ereboglobus sp. PH5-10]
MFFGEIGGFGGSSASDSLPTALPLAAQEGLNFFPSGMAADSPIHRARARYNR